MSETFYTSDCKEFEAYAEDCLTNQHEGTVVHVGNDVCVWTGVLKTLSLEECEKRGLAVGHGRYVGGTIVCFHDDVSICHTSWGADGYGESVFAMTKTWLKQKRLNVTSDNNDILVDDKKVFSYASIQLLSGWVQTVVHFSVEVDLDLIKSICKKNMEKIPGALKEYGIDSQTILQKLQKKEFI